MYDVVEHLNATDKGVLIGDIHSEIKPKLAILP